MKRIMLCMVLGLAALAAAGARLRLPPVFASGMVLQQRAEVKIRGWAGPGDKVTLKAGWNPSPVSGMAGSDGRWTISIATPAADMRPQTLTITSSKEHIELTDILIGDVWVVGGQSNMQMSFAGNPDQPVADAQKILLRSRYDGIRLFRVEPGYALEANDTISINGAWYRAGPDEVKKFSVVGFIFGERLHTLTGVPIGVVQSAHGGSTAEAWMDRATLERFGEFDLDTPQEKVDPIWYAVLPTVLYNKMLAPMLPMSVKGAIWYQGEANVGRAAQYERLFPEMINAWRRYFDNPDMPFYYVQIAPYNYANANSALLREAQLRVSDKVDNVGMAVTLDVGEADVIHPARKEVVGERLAYWALNREYGFEAFECQGPRFRSMEVRDGRALLKFDHAENGLSFMGKTPAGFEVAGEDRVFHPAQARIAPSFWGNEGLEVWSGSVPHPVAVRYGFTNYVDGCLYNTEGLPASSFRTDEWDTAE